jgi:hypothetical protein
MTSQVGLDSAMTKIVSKGDYVPVVIAYRSLVVTHEQHASHNAQSGPRGPERFA